MTSRRHRMQWNVLANFAGQGWRALMSLVFVPFYLHILGVEAFGLIGLYTSLQLALGLLDAGLRPTLAREMARFTAGGMDATSIRTLLRSVEWPVMAVAVLIVAILALASPWLARHWVHPEHLANAEVARAFMVMGFVAGAQLVESLYDSCLAGLQRQVVQNAIITAIATLRGCGSWLAIMLVPTVSAFFVWQAAVTVLSLLALRIAVYRSLPPAEGAVRFDLGELRRVRHYAVGMLGIAIVSLLLTQSDRVLLAKFLPLADVGAYALAATVAGAISMLSGPIFNAFQPRLTELVERGDKPGLLATFRLSTKLMALLVGTAAAMLVLFGATLLAIWTRNPPLSARVAPWMAALTLSSLFNALATIPFAMQLAHGITAWTLRINAALLTVFIPALVFAILRDGGMGAALCAAVLTLAGLTASATMTFAKLLPAPAGRLWLGDVIRLLCVIFIAALALRMLVPIGGTLLAQTAELAAIGLMVLAAGAVADPMLRHRSWQLRPTRRFGRLKSFR